jgi:hypothetical protein
MVFILRSLALYGLVASFQTRLHLETCSLASLYIFRYIINCGRNSAQNSQSSVPLRFGWMLMFPGTQMGTDELYIVGTPHRGETPDTVLTLSSTFYMLMLPFLQCQTGHPQNSVLASELTLAAHRSRNKPVVEAFASAWFEDLQAFCEDDLELWRQEEQRNKLDKVQQRLYVNCMMATKLEKPDFRLQDFSWRNDSSAIMIFEPQSCVHFSLSEITKLKRIFGLI